MGWKEIGKISDHDIRSKLSRALSKLWRNDRHYFIYDVNEVTITNRLGCYLIPEFSNYDVDTEYNRYEKNIKKIIRDDGTKGPVKPDIIVHKRGIQTHNLLVIEAKKSSNPDCNDDLKKLEAYRENSLNYIHALYIEFNTGKNITSTTFIHRIEFNI